MCTRHTRWCPPSWESALSSTTAPGLFELYSPADPALSFGFETLFVVCVCVFFALSLLYFVDVSLVFDYRQPPLCTAKTSLCHLSLKLGVGWTVEHSLLCSFLVVIIPQHDWLKESDQHVFVLHKVGQLELDMQKIDAVHISHYTCLCKKSMHLSWHVLPNGMLVDVTARLRQVGRGTWLAFFLLHKLAN